MRTPVSRRIALLAAASMLLVAAQVAAAIDPIQGRWVHLPDSPQDPPQRSGPAAALRTFASSRGTAGMMVIGAGAQEYPGFWTMTFGDALGLFLIGPFDESSPRDSVWGATLVQMYPAPRWVRVGGSSLRSRIDVLWLEEAAGWCGTTNSSWGPEYDLPGGLGRFDHAVCAPPSSRRMYLFGGEGQRAGQPPASTWLLDDLWRLEEGVALADAWHALSTTGVRPAARSGHTMVYDAHRDRLLVFGGDTLAAAMRIASGDVWAYSIAEGAWALLSAVGPARSGHLAFYDPIRDRMVVVGGRDADGRVSGDVWSLSLGTDPQWSRLVPEGEGPSPRHSAAGAYDPATDRLACFGGIDSTGESAGGTWLLEFGQTAAPALECSAPATAFPGQRVRIRGIATSRLGILDTHTLRLASWEDKVVRSVALQPGQADTVDWEWAIPAEAWDHIATFTFRSTGTRVAAASEWRECSVRVAALTAQPSFETDGDRVLLSWEIGGAGAPDPAVDRRVGDGDWITLGSAALHGGLVTFVDPEVEPGLSVDYRLQFIVDGTPWIRGTVHVDVPTSDAPRVLAIEEATANPAVGTLSVRLALPAGQPAVVEVLDVSGRRVARRDVGAPSAGRHLLAFPEIARPGLYLVRARQGTTERVRRVSVIR